MLASGLLSIPIGYASGTKVAQLLYVPNWVYIVELDTRDLQNGLYRVPSDQFGHIEVEEGQIDRPNPHLAFAKNVDLEENTMEGVWRGSLSDRELMAELNKVHELRGTLEDEARRGFAIESQAWMIVSNATRSAVRSIVETFERGKMPDSEGDSVNEIIDEAIDQFEFDFIEDSRSSESPAEPDLTNLDDLDDLDLDAVNPEVTHD